MTPLWLDAVFAVVQMAILIGLIALGIWMVKRSFRIKILGVLISGYILIGLIVYFAYCRTGL